MLTTSDSTRPIQAEKRPSRAEGTQPGQGTAGDEPHTQDAEEAGGPWDPVPEVGQVVPVDAPDLGHHHLRGPAQLMAAVEQPAGSR